MTTPDKAKLVDGASWVDPDECIGCGRCEKPGHCEAIEMLETGKAYVHDEDCIGCGVCWSLCPTGAISYRAKEH
jgi:TPP-dependent indolepyruvate ferredoxin oxidoreductase alpha subunit